MWTQGPGIEFESLFHPERKIVTPGSSFRPVGLNHPRIARLLCINTACGLKTLQPAGNRLLKGPEADERATETVKGRGREEKGERVYGRFQSQKLIPPAASCEPRSS